MKKTCAVSGVEFEVTDADLNFYEKMGVPAPTLCPDERQRRRLAWRNERHLYRRECDLCHRPTISMFAADAPFPVYCQTCWWGDGWEPRDFGRDFDFSKSFFEQFAALQQSVPHMALAGSHCENSKYAPFSIYTKNGYMAVSCCYSEDVYHSYQTNRSKDCVDCSLCDQCELGYENINCQNCFDVRFSSFSRNCSSSWFLNNCAGCSDCFGCTNLRNKQFYFLNKKCTSDEYQKKLRTLNLGSGEQLLKLKHEFAKFLLRYPHRFFYGENNEHSTGDNIFNCKNAQVCFECRDLEDCKFCGPLPSPGGRDCFDAMYSPNSELLCDVLSGVNGYNLAYAIFSWDIKNGRFLEECFFGHDLLGCIGLKHADHCILNKKYAPAEYEKLRKKIIQHMQETGEWGEFFPIEISNFAYNETLAQEYFPLDVTDPGVKKNDDRYSAPGLDFQFRWREADTKNFQPATIADLPDDVACVDEKICSEILACEQCKKNYKIQRAELQFYQKMGLPIPRNCPDCRHAARMQLRNPRRLWERKCDDCGTKISTTFAPDRPEKILCEKCSLKIVN